MWHVSSRSSVETLRTAIHLLLTYIQVHMRYVRMIYLVGYSLSLTTLAVAVAIMLYIKSVLPTTCLLALNRHTCNCRRPSSPRPHQHTCSGNEQCADVDEIM